MPFRKGDVNYKGGRKKLSKEALAAKAISQEEFVKTASRMFLMTPQAICDEVNHPLTNSLTCLIGTMIVKAIDEADDRRASFVLERVIGKVADKLPEGKPAPILFQLATDKKDIEAIEKANAEDEKHSSGN